MDTASVLAILADCAGEVDANNNPVNGSEVVDVWELIVLNPKKVRARALDMIRLLKEWPEEFPLGGEVSYLAAGAVLGDNKYAFQLFAFGKLLNWWLILDPATVTQLPKDAPEVTELFEAGYLSIWGYRPHNF